MKIQNQWDFHKSLDHLHVGCVGPHSYFIPFQSAEAARTLNRSESDRFFSLCGEWDFHYCKNEAELNRFLEKDPLDFDEQITVPKSWQMYLDRDYDKPLYTNVRYPFPVDAPHVPAENPCGVYHRTVEISQDALQKFTPRLVFEGVDSCFYLFVNGQFAAYSQVSHTISEVDLTHFLQAGTNSITAVVFKWCDGSYLEDQDKIRLSGIFREVYLLFRDKEHIEDLFIRSHTETPFTSAKITFSADGCKKQTATYILTSPDGKTVASGTFCADGSQNVEIPVENPLLWNDETPYLYELLITCGTEVIRQEVGIRNYAIVDKVVYINGKKVKAKGVNRHDSHPLLGAATPIEHIYEDLMILKRHNVNFIRTSHYPNDPRFYELCDRLGFYVCDETDLETHGMQAVGNWDELTDSPDWTESYVDRSRHMMERDKNHACILMWSVGNESGCGRNHCAQADYFHSRIPGCFVHEEDLSRRISVLRRKEDTAGLEALRQDHIDLDSRMYLSEEELRNEHLCESAPRPMFLCEYSHAMGNGPGDLEQYWKLIYSHDTFFGGCVWEMTDHSVNVGTPECPKYVYGGYFGNPINDGAFCVDGLLYPDRRPHTGMLELKQVLRPCRAIDFDEKSGKITLKNYRHFTDLQDLDMLWKLEENGRLIRQGTIAELNVLPEQTATFSLDINGLELGKNSYLTVSFVQNASTLWADAGYEVGFEQFELTATKQEKGSAPSTAKLEFAESTDHFTVRDGKSTYTVNRLTGLVCSMVNNGKELLTSPIVPNIWRAPTDNDRKIRREWEGQHFHLVKPNCYCCKVMQKTENQVVIASDLILGADSHRPIARGTVTYRFAPDRGLTMDFAWNVNIPENCVTLPRLGVQFTMPKGFEELQYFGLGKTESYQDKRQAAKMGLYSTTVTDHFEHYIRPQENMAHDDTAWVSVTDGTGCGITASGANESEKFSFNCSHFTPKQLTETEYDFELVPMEETVVNLDWKQAGIGSNSCGPVLPERYRIPSGHYSFSICILPTD